MWKRSAISLLLVLSCAESLLAARLTANTTWSGSVVLAEETVVAPGATLIVAPGTVVKVENADAGLVIQGKIKVAGSAAAPVKFVGVPGWKGISLVESGEEASRIVRARFDGAENAISIVSGRIEVKESEFRNCGTAIKLVREARVTVEGSSFEENQIGIDNEMKSQATITRNRFVGHKKTAILGAHGSGGVIDNNLFEKNEQGIGLLQPYPDRIVNNRFVQNKVGIYCNQTTKTPQIVDNLFTGNEIGLVNFSFSYPAVEHNQFLDNDTAVRNDQFSSPLLSHNLIRGSKLAVFINRKSNPKVVENVIEGNEKAFFCDYSSYPIIKRNNLTENKVGVELGIFQSADWEKRAGSKSIVQEEARARNSRNQMIGMAPTEFEDVVDVSENWWGEQTKMLAADPSGNHPIFFDRRDKPEVVYEGFGPESYALDEIRYAPWLKAAVAGAGPGKKK